MSQHDPVLIMAGMIVILGAFALIAYVVKCAPPARVAIVLTAVATVLAAIPVIVYALGGA
jgi:hypothetical protein